MRWAIGTGGTVIHPVAGRISFMPLITILVSLLVQLFLVSLELFDLTFQFLSFAVQDFKLLAQVVKLRF